MFSIRDAFSGDSVELASPNHDAGTARRRPMAEHLPGSEYETVAASQTDQVLGPTGATGDLINGILVIPPPRRPARSLKDGAGTVPVFTGGATSVSNLVPFLIPLGIRSVSGFPDTTGANVSCIAVGDFT